MNRVTILVMLTIALVLSSAVAEGKGDAKKHKFQRKSEWNAEYVSGSTTYPLNFDETSNSKQNAAVSTGYYFSDDDEKIGMKWLPEYEYADTSDQTALWRKIDAGPNIRGKKYWTNNPPEGMAFFRNPADGNYYENLRDSSDNAIAGPIPLGIEGGFYFNGVRYDSFFVSTNGLISLSNRRYYYDENGEKTIPEGAKNAYDPMSMDWFVTGDTEMGDNITGTRGRLVERDDMGNPLTDEDGNYIITSGLDDRTPDNFGHFYAALGNNPEDIDDETITRMNGLRSIPDINGTPGVDDIMPNSNKSPIIAPFWGDLHLSQFNENLNDVDGHGKVYYKRSLDGKKLIISFFNIAPKGVLWWWDDDDDEFTINGDQNLRPSNSDYISANCQVVLDASDSSITIAYTKFNGALTTVPSSYNNLPDTIPAEWVFQANTVSGITGFSRNKIDAGTGETVPENDYNYPWASEYEQFTHYYSIAKDRTKDYIPVDNKILPDTNIVVRAVKYKQWQNTLRASNVHYRVRSTNLSDDLSFSQRVPFTASNNYELIAGEKRLGAIKPVGIIQNLTNDIQGIDGVNYVEQDLEFQARLKIINEVTGRTIYNKMVPISNRCLSLDESDAIECIGEPSVRVNLASSVTNEGDGNYKTTTYSPSAYRAMGFEGVPSYGFAKIEFPPFEPNRNFDNNIGRQRVQLIAEPIQPGSGENLGDQWPFDDTVSASLFVMRRIKSLNDDVTEYHVEKTSGVPIPSAYKWVSIGAEVVSADEFSKHPLPPRGTYESQNDEFTKLSSPVIRMNRVDFEGNDIGTSSFSGGVNALYNFDDGTNQGWNFSESFGVRSDESFTGDFSIGTRDGYITSDPQAFIRPDILEGGVQIAAFEFYWYEESFSNGGGISLEDANGREVLGLASNNPDWCVIDGQSGSYDEIYNGDGYERWILFRVTFNWNTGEYSYYMEDLLTGSSRTGTRQLKRNTNIETIEIRPFNNGWTRYRDVYMWFDNITIGNVGSGDVTGDELRSFPIDIRGKEGAILSLAVQRAPYEKDRERNFMDEQFVGPEPRILYSDRNTSSVFETASEQLFGVFEPDRLVVEFAEPSIDGINGMTNDINWQYHPRRNGSPPETDMSALTIFGGGGHMRGFLEDDPDSALAPPQAPNINGLRADVYDDGFDYEYQKFFVQIPDTFMNWKNDASKNFRFRVKVKAKDDSRDAYLDDYDDFFVDNIRLLVPEEATDIEVTSVKVDWPYTAIPASQATVVPITVSMSNNTAFDAPVFVSKVRIFRLQKDEETGEMVRQTDPIYCRVENVGNLNGGHAIDLKMPHWNVRKSQIDSVAWYRVQASVILPEGDLIENNNVTYTDVKITFSSEFAYNYDIENPTNDVPEEMNIIGRGLNMHASNYGGGTDGPFTTADRAGTQTGDGSGQIAIKFQLMRTDTIKGYKVYFASLNQSPDFVKMRMYYDDNGLPSVNVDGTPDIIPNSEIIRNRMVDDRTGVLTPNQLILYQLNNPIILPKGTYWLTIEQLSGKDGFQLGASASRTAMRTTRYYDANDGIASTPDTLGSKGLTVFIDKGLRNTLPDGSVVNENFYAFENTTFTGDWNAFSPDEGNPAFPHWMHNHITLSNGTWMPLVRPYFGMKSSGSNYDDFQFCPDDIPVEILTFNGETRDDRIDLFWETATETNNYGFYVEKRKYNAEKEESWEKLDFISGAGNSSTMKYYDYADKNVVPGNTYQYRIKQVDLDGTETCAVSEIVTLEFNGAAEFALSQNKPNPFDNRTYFSFTLPSERKVKVEVLDIYGNVVKTLADGFFGSGSHELAWNADNESGQKVPAGTYIYRVSANNEVITNKMSFVK